MDTLWSRPHLKKMKCCVPYFSPTHNSWLIYQVSTYLQTSLIRGWVIVVLPIEFQPRLKKKKKSGLHVGGLVKVVTPSFYNLINTASSALRLLCTWVLESLACLWHCSIYFFLYFRPPLLIDNFYDIIVTLLLLEKI